MIQLVIYIADNCDTCQRVVDSATRLSYNLPYVKLLVKNIKEYRSNASIVPAVFVNQNLFCYGDFDNHKLLEMISEQNCEEILK